MARPRRTRSASAPAGPDTARLALLVGFLLEARRLDLLPQPVAHALDEVSAGSPAPLAEPFLEARDAIGLAEVDWPLVEGPDAAWAVGLATAHCQGDGPPRAAAERLGRLCERLADRGPGRRRTGSYYTPPWVADLIAERLLDRLVDARGGNPAAALSLRALDPAAGAGVFAVALIEAIAERAGEDPGRNDLRRAAARDVFRGIDLDPVAALACRLALWLNVSRPGRPALIPRDSIAVRDALAQPPAPRSVDLVLGNPPWGLPLSAPQAAVVAAAPPAALKGHRDSVLFFLHAASEAVRDDGALGLVLPEALLWQVRYEGMRQALLERLRPLHIALLGSKVFPGTTAPACALCLVGRPVAPGRFTIVRAACGSGRGGVGANPASAGQTAWEAAVDAPRQAAHTSFLLPAQWQQDLLRRMGEAHPRLGDLGDRLCIRDAGINYPRAELGRAILYTGPRQDGRDLPVVRGRDFGPLTAVGHSAWLRHDWRERVPLGSGVSVRERLHRTAPKLLLRQTGDRPVATIDRRGVTFGRSVIAVTAGADRDLLWLAAVLTSRAFAALYRSLAPEAGRPFAQVKVSTLKLVPVPPIDCPERPSASPGAGLAPLAERLLAETDGAGRAQLLAELDSRVEAAYGMTAEERRLVAGLVGC